MDQHYYSLELIKLFILVGGFTSIFYTLKMTNEILLLILNNVTKDNENTI